MLHILQTTSLSGHWSNSEVLIYGTWKHRGRHSPLPYSWVFFEIPLITDDLSCPKSSGILKISRKLVKESIKTTKKIILCWKFSDEREVILCQRKRDPCQNREHHCSASWLPFYFHHFFIPTIYELFWGRCRAILDWMHRLTLPQCLTAVMSVHRQYL